MNKSRVARFLTHGVGPYKLSSNPNPNPYPNPNTNPLTLTFST